MDAVEEEFEHLRSILATSLATFMVIPLFWAFANLHEGLAFLLPARVQIERRSIINRHEGVASLLSVLFIVLLLLLRVVFVRLERSFVLPDAKKITGRWCVDVASPCAMSLVAVSNTSSPISARDYPRLALRSATLRS